MHSLALLFQGLSYIIKGYVPSLILNEFKDQSSNNNNKKLEQNKTKIPLYDKGERVIYPINLPASMTCWQVKLSKKKILTSFKYLHLHDWTVLVHHTMIWIFKELWWTHTY